MGSERRDNGADLARAACAVICAVTLALLTGGCAVMRHDNRHTLNAMDAHLAPESEAGRWASAPVALPAAFVGLAADALVVHPATVFDDAWADTVDWLWTPAPDESRFRRAVLLPLVTIATPFVYVGDWFGRAFFAVPPRPPRDEQEPEEPA